MVSFCVKNISTVLKYKDSYVGDNSAVVNIVNLVKNVDIVNFDIDDGTKIKSKYIKMMIGVNVSK